MKVLRFSQLLPVCLFAWLIAGTVLAQEISLLEEGVVKVQVKEKGETGTGTGFIIKLSDNQIYIATAAHVIWEEEEEYSVEVEFKAERGTPVVAKLHQLDEDIDLAVLMVNRKDAPANIRALEFASLANRLSKGDEIRTIGFPRGAPPWAVVKGNYVGLENRVMKFTGAVDAGASGSPIIKNNKVFGLVTETGPNFSNAIPLTTMIETLDGWDVLPSEEDKLNTEAKLAFNQGEYKRALKAWRAVLETDPSNSMANQGMDQLVIYYLNQSQMGLQAEDCYQAETQLDEAKRIRPGHEEINAVRKMIATNCRMVRYGSVDIGFIYVLSTYTDKDETGERRGDSDGNVLYNLGVNYRIRDGQYLNGQLQYGTISFTDFAETTDEDWFDITVLEASLQTRTPWFESISWALGVEYWSWQGSLKNQSDYAAIIILSGSHSLPPRGLRWIWNVSGGGFDPNIGSWKVETGLTGRLLDLPLEYTLAGRWQLYDSAGDNYYKMDARSGVVKLSYLF